VIDSDLTCINWTGPTFDYSVASGFINGSVEAETTRLHDILTLIITESNLVGLYSLVYIQGRTGHACIWTMPGGPVGLCKQTVIFTWEKCDLGIFVRFYPGWVGRVVDLRKIALAGF